MEDKAPNRAIGTFISVVVIMIIMAIYGCATDDEQAQSATAETLYQGVPLDTHLLALDKEALEEAYKQHVMLLFSVWLKDDVNVVHRINKGLENGRRAYRAAAQKIEERETK